MENLTTNRRDLFSGPGRASARWFLLLFMVVGLQSCYYHAYDHDAYDDDVYYGRDYDGGGDYYDHGQDYHGSLAVGYGSYGNWSSVGFFGPFGYVSYLDHRYYGSGYYRPYPYYGYGRSYVYNAPYYSAPRRHRSHRGERRRQSGSPYLSRHNPDAKAKPSRSRGGDRSSGRRHQRSVGVVSPVNPRIREDRALQRSIHDDRRGKNSTNSAPRKVRSDRRARSGTGAVLSRNQPRQNRSQNQNQNRSAGGVRVGNRSRSNDPVRQRSITRRDGRDSSPVNPQRREGSSQTQYAKPAKSVSNKSNKRGRSKNVSTSRKNSQRSSSKRHGGKEKRQ